MTQLVIERVRDGVVALRKPADTIYHPNTLDEFHCLKHNIFLHKNEEGVSMAIRNDGRDVNGETINMIQVELSKEDATALIKELQFMIQ